MLGALNPLARQDAFFLDGADCGRRVLNLHREKAGRLGFLDQALDGHNGSRGRFPCDFLYSRLYFWLSRQLAGVAIVSLVASDFVGVCGGFALRDELGETLMLCFEHRLLNRCLYDWGAFGHDLLQFWPVEEELVNHVLWWLLGRCGAQFTIQADVDPNAG